MDAMTQGIRQEIANNAEVAEWTRQALGRIRRDGHLPDFVVGKPGAFGETLEDEGRTLILPLTEEAPKCYAALNETGGVTVMLAEEY